MPRGTWIEAALNGPWGRDRQPGIPITRDEIVADAVAAADEGAAIIHFHAYDPETGRQRDDWELYAPTIEAIRNARDVIVCPTVPLAGGPDARGPLSPEARYAAVAALAERGLIEWAVVDPGSAMFTSLDAARRLGAPGFLYENPEDHVRHGLALCREYDLVPSFAIYEPGFARLGAALAEGTGGRAPIYRFMFSDGLSFGFPPRPYGLESHLSLLAEAHPGAAWMVAGLDADIRPLASDAVRRGGHLRAGLEDARLGDLRTNAELIRDAASAVIAAGGHVAGTSEVRTACD